MQQTLGNHQLFSFRHLLKNYKILCLCFIIGLTSSSVWALMIKTSPNLNSLLVDGPPKSIGPFLGEIQPDDTCKIVDNTLRTVFKPGETLAWATTVTMKPGIEARAHFTLIKVDNGYVAGVSDYYLDPNTIRQGTNNHCVHINAKAPDGKYGIDRYAIYIHNKGLPFSQSFPMIYFYVKTGDSLLNPTEGD